MRPSQNSPLLPLALGIAALGGLAMQWASKETQTSAPGSGVPAYIEAFIKWAKDKPESIKEPESYLKS